MNAEPPAQGVMSNLPCCCFTRRACYRDDFITGLPAIFSGQLTERYNGILDLKQALSGRFFLVDVFADNRTNGAFCEGIANVIVPVEILARDRKKAVARFCRSRVRAYAGEGGGVVLRARSRKLSSCYCYQM